MYIILIISLIILTIVLWFAAIIDITRSRFKEPYINTISLLAVLFFPVLGSIIYFLLKKQLTTKAPKKFQPNFNRKY